MAQPAGPTTESDWTSRVVSGFSPLLTRPSDGDGAGYAVAAHHRVVSDATGDPVLSLTLLLDGVPDAAEHDVTPRVRRATLGVRVTLDAPVEALAATGLRPLYVRDGNTRMTEGESTELATAAVAGASSATSLSVSLDRDQTLAVLAALDGEGEDITVASTLWYRAVEPPGRVHLTGSWAEVHDVLAAQQGPPDLQRLFSDVLGRGVVTADPPDRPAAALPSFLSMARAVLLDRDGLLGARPSEYFRLDIDARSSGTGVDRYLKVITPLREVLGGCLAGRDRSRFISLVALSAEHDSATSDPVRRPRRVNSPRATRADLDVTSRSPRFVQTVDGRLASTAARVGAIRPAQGVLTAHAAQIVGDHPWSVGLDDATDTGTAEPDLPLVSDPQATTFPARAGATGWYAPSFAIVAPRPEQDASTSPFVFEFARTGTTLAGLPGLTATVTFRLRPGAPAGADGLRPLPTAGVGVVFDLPFRDAAGTDQRQRFPATVHWDGADLVAHVTLLDDWARMAYGALSRPDFQSEPARIGLTWSFTGCERIVVGPDWVVSGGKTAVVPVVYGSPHPVGSNGPRPRPGPRPEEVYIDASTATLTTTAGDYRFQARTGVAEVARGASVIVHSQLVAPTLRALRVNVFRPVLVNEFAEEAVLIHPQRVTRLVQRTFLRGQTVDALLPCDELGACYVERKPEGLVAVGCQDTLRLGQTDWRQYAEITALTDPAYRVYRSLQQPGRFVVLPKRYVVARRRAGEPDSWQPAILLYSLVDPDDTGDNQVVVDATLAPDVTPWAMASLKAALRGYAADPVLTFATDVEATPTFTWTVVGIDGLSVTATLVDGGVRVGIKSDLNRALLLRDMLEHTGLPGAVTLRLPDGSEMRSALQVDLRAQTGPAPKGPVELSATGRRVTAVNRIERRVDLAALRIDDGTSTLTDVPVETSLVPGAATTVNLPGNGAVDLDRCWPVYTVPDLDPVELPEIRSYVEDIRTNVVFLDLIDYPSRGIVGLDVIAQLVGAGEPQPVAMSGKPAVGSAMFVLPLTTYLGARQIRYQVTVTHSDGTTRASTWLVHDAASGGSLIDLTWDTLGFH